MFFGGGGLGKADFELPSGASLGDRPVGPRDIIKGNRPHGWGRKDALLEAGEQTLEDFCRLNERQLQGINPYC